MKKYHLTSPYVTTLIICLVVLSTGGIGFSCYLLLRDVTYMDEVWSALILIVLELMLYIIVILDGHELTSYYKIESNQLSLHAIGKKTWRLDLRDCQDIGIDYSVLSGGIEQYWMYFTKEQIPKRCFHNMTRLRYSPTCIRIQFSEKAYQIIYDGSSPDVQRKLKNAHSVIDNLRRKGVDDW